MSALFGGHQPDGPSIGIPPKLVTPEDNLAPSHGAIALALFNQIAGFASSGKYPADSNT
jgi:hypothetical protein